MTRLSSKEHPGLVLGSWFSDGKYLWKQIENQHMKCACRGEPELVPLQLLSVRVP